MQLDGIFRQADRARSQGAEIFVVAIGDNPDMEEVNGIASDPDSQHVVRVRTPNGVSDGARALLDQICQ